MARCSCSSPAPTEDAAPPRTSISPPSRRVRSRTSGGPSPRRMSSASSSSRAFPTARPSGASIEVSQATVRQPSSEASETRVRASRRASSGRRMKAPEPTLTSSTSPSRSSASFLLRMLAAMSGMESTVAVTSRSAYSRRSAGSISSVCPRMHTPSAASWARASASERSERKPGMAGELVERAAGVPEPAAGHHRDHHAAGGHQRRQAERHLVSHPAGGMLVDLLAPGARPAPGSPRSGASPGSRLAARRARGRGTRWPCTARPSGCRGPRPGRTRSAAPGCPPPPAPDRHAWPG